MALTLMPDFTFKHVNQADQVSGDPAAYKTNMDSQPKAIRDFMNGTHKTEIDAHLAEISSEIILYTRTLDGLNETIAVPLSQTTRKPKRIDIKVFPSGTSGHKASIGSWEQNGQRHVQWYDDGTCSGDGVGNAGAIQAVYGSGNFTLFTISGVTTGTFNLVIATTGTGSTGQFQIQLIAHYHD